MYLINRSWLQGLFLVVLLPGFVGCDREEVNFSEIERLPPASDFFCPAENKVIEFRQINRLDSAEPIKTVWWTWGPDTLIGDSVLKQLTISNADLDMLLPTLMILEINSLQIRRFVENYLYPMFRTTKLNNRDSIRSEVPGVKPHYYLYWWKHNIDKLEGHTPSQYRAYCGIDSIWGGEPRGKTVTFELTSGVGITKVDMIELSFFNIVDTVRHYTLERVF